MQLQPDNQPEKLKILYLFGGEKAQGAEIVIERLMAQVANQYSVHLILSPGSFADELIAQNKPYKIKTLANLQKLNRAFTSKFQYYSKAVKNYIAVSRYVLSYMKANDIRVVHSNTLVPSAYIIPAVIYSKLTRSKVKWIWSDHDLAFFSKLELSLGRACLKLYDKTLIVSNALKRKYGARSSKIEVLYNGLDVNQFKRDQASRDLFRNEWNFNQEDIVIAIAGSINPDKGQLHLIEIFKRLASTRPNIKLVLAGFYATQFPDHVIEIQEAIDQQANIQFVGFITDTAALFNGCDIVVNNSNNTRSESLGTTIYEAMACEKVVIASNTGGTPEIIDDNLNGLLFKTEDIAGLEAKLAYAIDDFDKLDHIRLQARQKVLQRFDIKAMAKSYQAIIETLHV